MRNFCKTCIFILLLFPAKGAFAQTWFPICDLFHFPSDVFESFPSHRCDPEMFSPEGIRKHHIRSVSWTFGSEGSKNVVETFFDSTGRAVSSIWSDYGLKDSVWNLRSSKKAFNYIENAPPVCDDCIKEIVPVEFDEKGRVTFDGIAHRFEYDSAGHLISRRLDPPGGKAAMRDETILEWGPDGLLRKVVKSAGKKTEPRPDYHSVSTYSYADGKLAMVKGRAESSTVWRGELIGPIDIHKEFIWRDGRCIKIVKAETRLGETSNQTFRYSYDSAGLPLLVDFEWIDAGNHITEWQMNFSYGYYR